MNSDGETESQSRILPLISDRANRELVEEWIKDAPSYEYVDFTGDLIEASFDVCIIDEGGFQKYLSDLREKKTAAAPVLLPYLLLLPESGSEVVETDAGQIADNVVTETVDELVSMPIRQAELDWRLTALLRLRHHSLTLRSRERQLERQVDLFEKAQDIANVGAWEYDIDTEEAWWTDEARRIHALPEGTDPSPALSFQYYHSDDRESIKDAFEAAAEEGEPYDLELRFIDAEDTHRWVRTRGEPQCVDGTVTRIRGTIRDITERKERERDLQRIKQAVESSGHGIYITDPDGNITYVNSAFEETTGFSKEEVVGETPDILNSGEMSDDYIEKIWETLRSGEIWEEEVINRRKNGEKYTARQTIAPVTDGGKAHAFVAVHEDITERIEREETLKRRTQAIDEAPVGITISDPSQEDNPLIYVNDAFVEMTGYQREDTLGDNCRFLQGEATDPDRVAEMREAIDAQEPVSVELRNYRNDGTEFWNHLEIAPVRNGDSEVVNWIGFQQEVTERKVRQRQLEVLDRVLRHNLRNDMNIIQGHAETIHSATSGEVAASAGEIVDMSDQLVELAEKERKVTELLRQEPTREEIRVKDLLRSVVSTIAAEYPDATFSLECPDDVTVHATARFEEAISELVTNAIVHNDASSPEVSISSTQSDETAKIQIADNGPPIPEGEQSILVDEHEQTPLYHGSGLGLWLVKLITSQSGGSFSIQSNSSTGNIVTIEIPR